MRFIFGRKVRSQDHVVQKTDDSLQHNSTSLGMGIDNVTSNYMSISYFRQCFDRR